MRPAVRRALAGATGACALANGVVVVGDLVRADFVLTNSAAVGVPPRALPVLALLKGAGAGGLVAGLAGARPLGLAAASGLVLFFTGAVAAHVRARVFASIGFPAAYLALAGAAATYFALE
jgi:hypothetical protein